MAHSIHHINLDCLDPHALAPFWLAVTGFLLAAGTEPEDDEVLLVDPSRRSPNLLLTRVPEPRVAKNRMHLDLQPTHTTRERSVEELVALGATVLDDGRTGEGGGWVVLADPEGNELCIERAASERGPDPWLPAPRTTGVRVLDAPRDGDERTTLCSMLDWYREGVVRKLDGLTHEQANRRLLTSDTTLAGIVNHLALVEDTWFTHRIEGRPDPAPWDAVDWAEDPDWDFHHAADEPVEVIVERYRVACERSRAVVAAHDLDDIAADTSRHRFTVRWTLVHLIEETARHLGHMDLLRELTDATTGE